MEGPTRLHVPGAGAPLLPAAFRPRASPVVVSGKTQAAAVTSNAPQSYVLWGRLS